jgi:alkylated DNA repair dioxygenase AlkB
MRMPRARASDPAEWPEGFSYKADFLNATEETELLRKIQALEFKAFEFQGYTAKRRIVEYGYEYDFSTRRAAQIACPPEFLDAIRRRAADFSNIPEDDWVEVLITEYSPGTPIGWHRDVPQFEEIMGISLASGCRMRLKPYKAEGKLISVMLEPRSIYMMRGVARWSFQHSIPPLQYLRYSITLRTLRRKEEA